MWHPTDHPVAAPFYSAIHIHGEVNEHFLPRSFTCHGDDDCEGANVACLDPSPRHIT